MGRSFGNSLGFSGFGDFSSSSASSEGEVSGPRSRFFWDWGIFGIFLGFGVLRGVRGGSWKEKRDQILIFFFAPLEFQIPNLRGFCGVSDFGESKFWGVSSF